MPWWGVRRPVICRRSMRWWSATSGRCSGCACACSRRARPRRMRPRTRSSRRGVASRGTAADRSRLGCCASRGTAAATNSAGADAAPQARSMGSWRRPAKPCSETRSPPDARNAARSSGRSGTTPSAPSRRASKPCPRTSVRPFCLCDVHGLAYQEIAAAMGTSVGTVKSRVSRGRARLRDYLLASGELPSPDQRPDDREPISRPRPARSGL